MKTCSLYNLPKEVAAEAINSMKDYMIKKIKKDDFEDLVDLVFSLQSMQEAYERMMQEDEDNA